MDFPQIVQSKVLWQEVRLEHESLKIQAPTKQVEGACGTMFEKDKVLKVCREAEDKTLANVCGNLAWVVPLEESLPGDTLSYPMVIKYVKNVAIIIRMYSNSELPDLL